MSQKIVWERASEFPPQAISFATMEWNATGSWRHLRPIYQYKPPPCTFACPADVKIPRYFHQALEGKYEEAWRIIMKDHPLPATMGRVCYRFCERGCNRQYFDETIAIRAMERFIGDYGIEHGVLKPAARREEGRVAILGGGPAGLACAYHLTLRGHEVTIFEAQPRAGGILRYGIPEYRLPRRVVDAEVARIESLGVRILGGSPLGRSLRLSDLGEEFRAVYLAIGAGKSKRLGVPGEELPDVLPGLEFLAAVNSGREVPLGKRVAIIGGGNTAMDTCRTALRLGASPVVVYRRSREEMPAVPEEVDEAMAEGVEFHLLAAPLRVLGADGKVTALECQRMGLGEPDASGRRRPVPLEGSEFTILVDMVLTAIGEEPDDEVLPEGLRLEKGLVAIEDGGGTSLPGIFAGGDVANGARGTVVDALAAGKRAAQAIRAYLRGEPIPPGERRPGVPYEALNVSHFARGRRPHHPELPREVALGSFLEVVQGLPEEAVLAEMRRCFSCGLCTACDNCLLFCPDAAVARLRRGKGYQIDYAHCKGCGICVAECPRSAMSLVEEVQCRR